MKIDEPETPWASPPKELFEDPADGDGDGDTNAGGGGGGGGGGASHTVAGVAMDDVAERLKEIERSAGPASGSGGGGVEGGSGDGWDSSDDEGDDGTQRGKGGSGRKPKLSFPDPRVQPGDGVGGGGGASTSNGGVGDGGESEDEDEDGDEGPLDDVDKVLKARLFEAQRKSHQCTFRGVMARGRALLEEEDEED